MCYCLGIMYLRCFSRKKNGKRHRYWSVVESRRLRTGKTAQRQVLYLGEINDSQQAAWRQAMARDGSYILRAWIPWEDWPKDLGGQAPTLWAWYMQLVQVEEAFRTLKSDLDLRPIFHQVEPQVDAHILVAFLGHCLSVTLRAKLRRSAPGAFANSGCGLRGIVSDLVGRVLLESIVESALKGDKSKLKWLIQFKIAEARTT